MLQPLFRLKLYLNIRAQPREIFLAGLLYQLSELQGLIQGLCKQPQQGRSLALEMRLQCLQCRILKHEHWLKSNHDLYQLKILHLHQFQLLPLQMHTGSRFDLTEYLEASPMGEATTVIGNKSPINIKLISFNKAPPFGSGLGGVFLNLVIFYSKLFCSSLILAS